MAWMSGGTTHRGLCVEGSCRACFATYVPTSLTLCLLCLKPETRTSACVFSATELQQKPQAFGTVSCRELRQGSLRGSVAVVPQDTARPPPLLHVPYRLAQWALLS